MNITVKDYGITINRDSSKKLYSESAFWYAVKMELKRLGYNNLIKKEMVKDGHLTSENVYYLRDKNWNYCIYDIDYAIRDITADYNNNLEISLKIKK